MGELEKREEEEEEKRDERCLDAKVGYLFLYVAFFFGFEKNDVVFYR